MELTNTTTTSTTTTPTTRSSSSSWDLDMTMCNPLLLDFLHHPNNIHDPFPFPPPPPQFHSGSYSPEPEPDNPEDTDLGGMKEMMYKIAAMQPVDIDPSTIKKPKRRNVRISDDPQSVAARHRREKISERIRILQRLVPGGTKMDTASMLDEAIRYVKFLKRHLHHLHSAGPHPAASSSSSSSFHAAAAAMHAELGFGYGTLTTNYAPHNNNNI